MLKSVRLVLTLLTFAVAGSPLAACADAASEGQASFDAQCALCHDVSPAKSVGQGPPLFALMGRKMGSAAGFDYSEALKAAGTKGRAWDEATLDAFLADPQKVVPGTAMPIAVADAKDRKQIVAYIKGLNGTVAAPAAKPVAAKGANWRDDAPGVRHRVTVADLPPPFATASAGNSPAVVSAGDTGLKVPAGFTVSLFASDLRRPRQLRTAPNGDLFLAEAGAGRITVFRNTDGKLNPKGETFASDLKDSFGIAFYPSVNPKYVYVSSPTTVTRYPYGGGAAETIVADLSSGGGHSNRDLIFSSDGKSLYVAVGSGGNVADGIGSAPEGFVASHATGESWGSEARRALVVRFDPDGKNRKVFATGIRNCAGLGIRPGSNDLYCAVNERDGLGDDLVPDYLSRIREGGFYGWPWYYLGNHEDPRRKGERPDLAGKAIVPDLLFASHSAPLGFIFYQAPKGVKGFPAAYAGDAFVALHGSWNREQRTGSKVVRVLMKDGKPTGEYEDFLTGFALSDKTVSGRPVGVAVGPDSALYVSDDAGGKIWRISAN